MYLFKKNIQKYDTDVVFSLCSNSWREKKKISLHLKPLRRHVLI